MDSDNKGFLNMNEIEETLLSLGLASNRAEVISNIQEACKSSSKP